MTSILYYQSIILTFQICACATSNTHAHRHNQNLYYVCIGSTTGIRYFRIRYCRRRSCMRMSLHAWVCSFDINHLSELACESKCICSWNFSFEHSAGQKNFRLEFDVLSQGRIPVVFNELHRMLFRPLSGIPFDDIFVVVKMGIRYDQQT